MQSFIPYINSEDLVHVPCEEVESAIALLLSMSRNDSVVDELVKAYYPFMELKTDEGEIYFDLLLLFEAEKTQTASFDIGSLVKELVESNYDERDEKIHQFRSVITGLELDNFQIGGLISDQRIHDFLRTAQNNVSIKTVLFKPQLTQKQFKSIRDKLGAKEKDREALLTEISQARKDLQAFITKMETENREKHESYIEESGKKLDALEKTNIKAVKEIENSLTKSLNESNKTYDSRANDLREELEYINNAQKEIEGGSWDARKSRLENQLKTRQISRQLENLEKERAKELSGHEENAEKVKEALKTQFLEEETKEKQGAEKLDEANKDSLEKIEDTTRLLENLEARIDREREYLARILGVKYKDGDLIHVPFYIHKSDNVYGTHTPLTIQSTGGVKKTLKLMLADNLRDKISQHIRPETESMNLFMERLVNQLSEESKIQKEYNKRVGEDNILVSRSMLDKIEVGLYRLFEWEWINEKDYMVAQRCLVEKMDALNGGTHYSRDLDPIIDVSSQQEIPA